MLLLSILSLTSAFESPLPFRECGLLEDTSKANCATLLLTDSSRKC